MNIDELCAVGPDYSAGLSKLPWLTTYKLVATISSLRAGALVRRGALS